MDGIIFGFESGSGFVQKGSGFKVGFRLKALKLLPPLK